MPNDNHDSRGRFASGAAEALPSSGESASSNYMAAAGVGTNGRYDQSTHHAEAAARAGAQAAKAGDYKNAAMYHGDAAAHYKSAAEHAPSQNLRQHALGKATEHEAFAQAHASNAKKYGP